MSDAPTPPDDVVNAVLRYGGRMVVDTTGRWATPPGTFTYDGATYDAAPLHAARREAARRELAAGARAVVGWLIARSRRPTP